MSASSDTSSIIEQIDIVKEISKHVQLIPKGSEYTACCPFHLEDTPSFFVNPQKRLFYCFGCQVGGNVINFKALIAGLNTKDAVQALANEYGLQISKQPSRQPLKDCLSVAQNLYLKYLKQSDKAQAYLKSRGLSTDIIDAFGVGYVPDEWQVLSKNNNISKKDALNLGMIIDKNGRSYDRFRSRVMFPIHDHLGTLVGFGGRSIDDSKPKYLNSADSDLYHKREVLYGLHQAIKAKEKHLIVVEGYMDVIALHQAGFKGAVASLGTAFTSEQFSLICQYADQLTFCFDGDRAGKSAAEKAFQTLLPLIRDQVACSFLFLDEGEDPDSYIQNHGAEAFRNQLEHALPFSTFLEDQASIDLNTKILDHQAQFIKRVHAFLEQMPNSITKKLIQKKHQLKVTASPAPKVTPQKKQNPKIWRLLELIFQYPSLRKEYLLSEDTKWFLPKVCQSALTMLDEQPNLSFAGFCQQQQLQYMPSIISASDDEERAKKELCDMIEKLKAATIKHHINLLIEKSKREGLSTEEANKLQQLLLKKQNLQKNFN